MKTKKYTQGLVTSLTALSTAILCQTTATYASDIEIYKAPTNGGATLMFLLDLSGSMAGSSPIRKDFFGGESCTTETKAVNTSIDGANYNFDGTYCFITKSTYDNLNTAWRARVDAQVVAKACIKEEKRLRDWYGNVWTEMTYSCPDRVTMLKRSLFDLIAGNSSVDGANATTNEKLPDTSSIGFTTFVYATPEVKQAPLVLNTSNRKSLLNLLKDWFASGGTPISEAYSVGAAGLMNHVSRAETACAGYGVYYLTDGEPSGDSTSTAATSRSSKYLNYYLKSNSQLTSSRGGNCTDSWSCVATAAGFLYNKDNTSNTEVKTAIVGFGKDFSFAHKTTGNDVVYDSSITYTDTTLSNYFSSNALAAAKAAVAGKGGWYSASNTSDIVNSVQNFVNSIKIPIPAITTGTSAIPQDALNTSVIQPYAYFPQFQPTPSEDFRAWAGNLKKYNVVGGILKDKGDTALFSSAGVLNIANEDLWTPNYAATLTAEQQRLKALGGLLSRLNLKKTGTTLNRKVFTSNGTTLETVNETYVKQAPASRGYYLGLLGYDVTAAQVLALNSSAGVDTLLTAAPELRKIGAVMHSTPVLLTQSGTVMENADGSVNTVNRDDYILFGTTQGVLHVVKAGRSNEVSTVGNTAGEEAFAFVPQEMLSAQGKAFLDPPQTVGTDTSTNGMNNLYYGVDGAWTAHTEYVYNNTDDTFRVYDAVTSKTGKQWVYGGLRMGGRSYYALDLTNMALPTLKFRINPTLNSVDGFTTPSGETARYANLAKMGQSWSKPTIANVQWKGKRRLVMFVGGGYDRGYETFNYDQDSVTQNTSTGRGSGIGAGIYMFDANTGEFLWSTYDAVSEAATNASTTIPKTTHYIGNGDELKYSVVSQIKGVDRDGDGDVDHLYFGDLGGQVFRVDLNSKHSASTGTATNYASQITRIYNGHVANGVSPRFYEMPAFTVYRGTEGLFSVISIGSGNRSTPLLGKQVNGTYIINGETAALNSTLSNDAIYNIYDTVVTTKNPATVALPAAGSPVQSNLYALTSGNRELNTIASGAIAPTNLAKNQETTNYKGWYYAFASATGRKAIEKVQGDLIAIDSDLYVSTFDAEGTDSTASCGAGIYGASLAHRFCMPYGQCANGDTVANNTLNLGKGLLGITMGPGTSGADRRIITPLESLPNGNKITGITYKAANKLIPQSWYEKN